VLEKPFIYFFYILLFLPHKEIDEFHPAAPFKYLKNKPVRDLSGEQFLKMCQAEQEKLVKIKLAIDTDTSQSKTYVLFTLIVWLQLDAVNLVFRFVSSGSPRWSWAY